MEENKRYESKAVESLAWTRPVARGQLPNFSFALPLKNFLTINKI